MSFCTLTCQIVIFLASERSERDTYWGNTIENRGSLFIYWRASEANETLLGVTQSRFRYIWRASVASETLRGVTQLKIGDVCLSVCMDVRMSFCTMTLAYFVFAPHLTPSQIALQNPLVYRSVPVSP